MKSFRPKIVLSGAVILVALGFQIVFGAVNISAACDPDAGKVFWRHLAYKGKHFLGKVETDVSLVGLPADEVQCLLIPVPEGNVVQVSSSHVMVISVQSVVDPLIGANDLNLTRSRAWFMPVKATALQLIRYRKGDDIWQNTYRFSQKGVYRLRKKPGFAEEKDLPPAQWTKIKESFYPYSDKFPGGCSVLEPTGLLYLVSSVDFIKRADPLILYVFDRKQLHQVKAYVSGHRRIEVDYLAKTPKNEVRKQGKIDAVKVSFSPKALAPKDTEPEEFSFLGLKGDFEIYIDSTSRLPVQVTGTIKGLGEVSIMLREVELVQ
jgi:hypothetical protein